MYTVSVDYDNKLGAVSRRLVQESPRSEHHFLVREAIDFGRREVEVWFRTAGCQYFITGGCTMCNYGFGKRVTADEMLSSVRDALATTSIGPDDKLLITPSGSMFDDWEVPVDIREGIFTIVRGLRSHSFKCEAQARYATDANMAAYRAQLPDRELLLVIGLESSNRWIRRHCLNKDLPDQTYLDALAACRHHQVLSSTNILVGTPFLTEREAIEDAVSSVSWALTHGVDEIFVFPVHVKVGTVTHWLWRHGLFSSPYLWSLIEVLRRTPEDALQRVAVAWHKSYYKNNPFLQQRKYVEAPRTCPKCYDAVVAGIDQYVADRSVGSRDRLVALECECKQDWRRLLDSDPGDALPERVDAILKRMTADVL